MNAGSLLYWAPNDKRSLRNIGATPASYQVIRVTSAKSPSRPQTEDSQSARNPGQAKRLRAPW